MPPGGRSEPRRRCFGLYGGRLACMLAWAAGSGSPLAGLERALQGLWAGSSDGLVGLTGADTRIEETP